MQFNFIIEIFNNREIATAIWLVIFSIWKITKLNIRKSTKKLAQQFFQYKIFIPYLLAVLYTTLGVYTLSKFDLWTKAQLKDTILWSALALISALFTLKKVNENKNFLRDAINEIFKFSIIIEFISGVYTFSLPLELMIVPCLGLIGSMQVFEGKAEKYSLTQKVLSGMLVCFGVLTIGHTIYKISIDINHFASFDTLRDFILSPFLALWILPFIYVISIYMIFEVYFILLKSHIKDKKLLRFAKWQALLNFSIDTTGLERWKNYLFIRGIDTKTDIINAVKEIKRLQKVEKNPPEVNCEVGWSPYAAKDFLISKGIDTKYYTNTYESDWSASSNYIKLDDDIIGNSISYYIEGNETIAKKLHLVLDINNSSNAEGAINKFAEYSKDLYLIATTKPLLNNVYKAILIKKNVEIQVGRDRLIVKKEDWLVQNKYSLMFYIHRD